MAKAAGVSASSVHRIRQAFCLQPHRTETFKLSADPQFVENVLVIAGAIILSYLPIKRVPCGIRRWWDRLRLDEAFEALPDTRHRNPWDEAAV